MSDFVFDCMNSAEPTYLVAPSIGRAKIAITTCRLRTVLYGSPRLDIEAVPVEGAVFGQHLTLRDHLLALLEPLMSTEAEQMALGVLKGDKVALAMLRDYAKDTT